MTNIRVYFYLKSYYYEVGEVHSIELDCKCSIRDFLNKVQKKFPYRDSSDDETQCEDGLDCIHCVYFKGEEIYENAPLHRIDLDLLECCPIFITDDKINVIENHIPFIDIDDYDNLEFYSQTLWGISLKAIDKKTNKKVLIKTIYESQYRDHLMHLIQYIPVSTLSHCGVSKILGFRYPLNQYEKKKTKLLNFEFIDKTKRSRKYKANADLTQFIIIEEFVQNGSIRPAVEKYIESKGAKNDKMNPTIRSKIAYGVASIMKYVHQKGIVHRYLRMDNILYDENFEPVISGFDQAIFFDEENKYKYKSEYRTIGRSIEYKAPEFFSDYQEDWTRYHFPIDVYAYAFLLFRLFTNKIIMRGKQPRSPQQYMMFISNRNRPSRPENIPDSYWELIQKCWKQDPSDRPTFDEIVEELKKDEYAIEEYGMKTNLDELHKYQKRIDLFPINDLSFLNKEIAKMLAEQDQQNQQIEKPISLPKEERKQGICFIDEEDEKFHKVISKIGEGATSVTYKVVDTRTGELMCKKIIKYIENDELAYKTLKNSMKEIEILFKISHPCIF